MLIVQILSGSQKVPSSFLKRAFLFNLQILFLIKLKNLVFAIVPIKYFNVKIKNSFEVRTI